MRILKDRISTNDIFLHIMEFPSCNRKEKNLYEIRIQRSMSIKLKRVYEPPAMDDGYRVLVERLWPRGVSKERAHVDLWMKDAGASRSSGSGSVTTRINGKISGRGILKRSGDGPR